jgi:hypothetical protein
MIDDLRAELLDFWSADPDLWSLRCSGKIRRLTSSNASKNRKIEFSCETPVPLEFSFEPPGISLLSDPPLINCELRVLCLASVSPITSVGRCPQRMRRCKGCMGFPMAKLAARWYWESCPNSSGPNHAPLSLFRIRSEVLWDMERAESAVRNHKRQLKSNKQRMQRVCRSMYNVAVWSWYWNSLQGNCVFRG